MENFIEHSGTPHEGAIPHSGRYVYGSGDTPYQRDCSFENTLREYKEKGFSESERATAMGMTVKELRNAISENNEQRRSYDLSFALHELEKNPNISKAQIAIDMGLKASQESYVRNLLEPIQQEKINASNEIKNNLKKLVDEGKYVDVGSGASAIMMVSEQKFKNAVNSLVNEDGYTKHWLKIPQATNPGKNTSVQVLAKPGTEWKEVNQNKEKITLPVGQYTYDEDGTRSSFGIEKPQSVDSSRIFVRYNEEGGVEKDGVIEIRRGTKDLTMGNASYAQVRIAVDDTHYMKGMAIYSDNVPDGYDIVYNSHRSVGTPLKDNPDPNGETVFKKMKKKTDENGIKVIDWDNPFGALLKTEDGEIVGQIHYTDDDGKTKLSPINIVRAESDWNKWSKTLSSQFLAKQPIELINKQLNASYKEKKEEFDEITALTNGVVKKKLLASFADDCDSSAVHLKAAALPNQSSKVILPISSLKDDQVYAPTYENGSQVVLIRYPHGGIFEIPKLTVNNKNKEGKSVIGPSSIDAIGINNTTAAKLSGADFDGDTVLVIPYADANGNIINKISTKDQLKELEGFDPQVEYKGYEGMKVMTRTNLEMGKISNLITDMTVQGAPWSELARAVKHSMVVIDAEKHHLDYTRSYKENGIAELKVKYQGGSNAGAGTIISRAKSEEHPLDRHLKTSTQIRTDEEQIWLDANFGKYKDLSTDDKKKYTTILNKMTESEYEDYKQGKKIYAYTGAVSYKKTVDKDGNITWEEKPKTNTSTKMEETEDALTLVSGNETASGYVKELAYANYANKLKALGNEARKEALSVDIVQYDPTAAKNYAQEVSDLKSALNESLKNSPKERMAQIYASIVVENKVKSNPDLKNDKTQLKKIKQLSLTEGRNRFEAKRSVIDITDKQWEAIQAGAVSPSSLSTILDHSDMDKVKQLATPRDSKTELTATQIARIKSLSSKGATLNDIANKFGVSVTTISNALAG